MRDQNMILEDPEVTDYLQQLRLAPGLAGAR